MRSSTLLSIFFLSVQQYNAGNFLSQMSLKQLIRRIGDAAFCMLTKSCSLCLLIALALYIWLSIVSCPLASFLRGVEKKLPTFFGKSQRFFGKSPTFLEKRPRFFEKCPTFFEEVPSIHWQSPRNAREMLEECWRSRRSLRDIKPVFTMRWSKTRQKGTKSPKISSWGIWAKNGFYGWNLHSLFDKMASYKFFLRFFCRKSW